MTNRVVLKNRIRIARAENNMTQADLADKVSVSRQSISSIEKGTFNPSAKLALLICRVFRKKFEELFYIEECYNEDNKECQNDIHARN